MDLIDRRTLLKSLHADEGAPNVFVQQNYFIELVKSAPQILYFTNNRVLVHNEALGSTKPCVFLEIKGQKRIMAADVAVSPDTVNADVNTLLNGKFRLPIKLYNRTWRCWEHNPTESERIAAEWEVCE